MEVIAAVLLVAILVFALARWWQFAVLLLAAIAFLALGPAVLALHVLSVGGNSDRAEEYLAVASWLPPVVSFIWFVIRASRQPRMTPSLVKPHILFFQPMLALFVGSGLAVLFVLEVTMQGDELLTMSLFALTIFLLCAWFLPHVLRPMLKLEGRSPQANAAMATTIGLILSLMVALAAFKARERFAELHLAMNTLIDAATLFIVAALSGAGALLAAQRVKAKAPSRDAQTENQVHPPASGDA